MDNEVIICKGTDIPPLSSRQFYILQHLSEIIEIKKSNILSFKEIFKGFTFNKSERFPIIYSLIKSKVLKRTRINYIESTYEVIPKISYRQCTEMRIYNPKNKNERLSLMKEFLNN